MLHWIALLPTGLCLVDALRPESDKENLAVPDWLCEEDAAPKSLLEAIPAARLYDFYPIGLNNDFELAEFPLPQEGADRGSKTLSADSFEGKEHFSLDTHTSMTAAHYYNVIVYLVLEFFGFDGHEDVTTPWIAPNPARPPDLQAAIRRFRPRYNGNPNWIVDLPTEFLDYHTLVLSKTSDTVPCRFVEAEQMESNGFKKPARLRKNMAVKAEEWTSCAQRLGLNSPAFWNDTNILNRLDFMFDNTIPPSFTKVSATDRQVTATAVPLLEEQDALDGAAVLGFAFGSGYDCDVFATCNQPGLTNMALAAIALRNVAKLAGGGNGTVKLFLQWEIAAAAAQVLGLGRAGWEVSGWQTKDGKKTAAVWSKCADRAGRQVCLYQLGDRSPHLYLDTLAVMALALELLGGVPKLVLLGAPDHLPRIYRTCIKALLDVSHEDFPKDGLTLIPALAPFDLNYPVSAQGSVINLYEGSPFLQANNFGLYSDNKQPWVRNRVVFRLFELFIYAMEGVSKMSRVPRLGEGPGRRRGCGQRA